MAFEFKAQKKSRYCGELRNETRRDEPMTLCLRHLDRCVLCADYIDEMTNESERKPYSSHSAMKYVGEGKCENGHKKYFAGVWHSQFNLFKRACVC